MLDPGSVVLVLKFSFSFGFGFLPKLLSDFGIILVYQKFYFQILVLVCNFNLKFQQEKLKFLEKLCISVGVKCNYHHF